MAKETVVTDDSRWNSKHEAWQVHGSLIGLVSRFRSNGLDPSPVERAVKALAEVAGEVQSKYDAQNAAKAEYRAAVNAGRNDDDLLAQVKAMREELAALKKAAAKASA